MLTRALGAPVEQVVALARDPRFLAGIIPSANVVVDGARAVARFFECLRCDGALDGVRVFEPRTVHRATSEQSFWEVDFTLGAPIRYGLGFMLAGRLAAALRARRGPNAFGHYGFTNVIGWADPDRELSAALLTSGKPFLNVELWRLFQLFSAINQATEPRA